MELPKELKYTREHEWLAIEDGVATIGITDHAQEQLGEVVFVELPAVGDKVERSDPFGVVESTKAVSDVYAPISGEVLEINDDLPDSPEIVNEDPYGDGWMVKISVADEADLEELMSDEEYRAYVEESEEARSPAEVTSTDAVRPTGDRAETLNAKASKSADPSDSGASIAAEGSPTAESASTGPRRVRVTIRFRVQAEQR